MSNAKEIELPWGTLSEAARRLGITRSAAFDGWAKGRKNVADAVADILQEHINERQESQKAVARAAELAEKINEQ